MTIRELILINIDKLDSESAKLDIELMLCSVLNVDRLYIHLNINNEISSEHIEEFNMLFEKRKKKIPMAYILNTKEFMGLDFFVKEGVLIPRPDTEVLVEEVIKLSKQFDENTIIDIGTGSGAISVSLAKYIDKCSVVSLDISDTALEVGSINAKNNGVLDKINFIKSDIFSGVCDDKRATIIVSNPPYIRKDVIPTLMDDVKNYEPHLALDGGEDGLDFYRQITNQANEYLVNGGYLAYEIGYDQAYEVMSIMNDNGFKDIYLMKDIAGLDRVVVGRKL